MREPGESPSTPGADAESGELDALHEFLVACLADRAAGGLRPLGDYLSRFPEHAARITREYERLQAATLAPVATGPRRIGPYELRRELGRGGQAVVHLAFDPRLRREVALKVLSTAASRLDQQLRLQREASVAGRLDDPGICPVYETGRDGDHVWLAMRHVTGRTLAAHVAEARPDGLPWPRVVDWFTALARSLHRAHGAGVVHRDLKPANVMIGPDERPVLLDFGLAADASDSDAPRLTHSGDRFGTPAYQPPEVLRGRAGDGVAADLWALAVSLFEALTGRRPFDGPTLAALQQAILDGVPPPLASLRRGLPRDLAALLAVALQPEPTHRYRDAAAFAADLAAVAAGRPIAARPPSPWRRAVWWHRRHGVAATALWALLLGGAFVAERSWANAHLAASLDGKVREFDLLAGVVRHRRAEAHAAALHPVGPASVPALQAWLRDEAEPLLTMRPELDRAIAALRARAVAAGPGAAPDAALLRQRRLVASLRRAAAIRAGTVPFEAVDLPAAFADANAHELRLAAHARVAHELDERTVLGEEAIGLACAQAAFARSQAGDASTAPLQVHTTLAWAWLANGLDDEALRQAEAMAAGAPEVEAAMAAFRARSVERAVADADERTATAVVALAEREAEHAAAGLRFATESAQFLHTALCDLRAAMSAFAAGTVPAVQRRLRWAASIGPLSRAHPKARHDWAAVRTAIAHADDEVASRAYAAMPPDLRDEHVVGLVPIGRNPATGLWEFYDLRSAWDGVGDPAELPIPVHGPDGALPVEAGTGIVFVLVPGGTFRMGESEEGRGAGSRDSIPEHDVAVAPFLMARHELTQAQWRRLWNGEPARAVPSKYVAGHWRADREIGWTHPVEQVTWSDCTRLCAEHGYQLPTEAQWEYACRAGSEGSFWCAADDLAAVANLADASAARITQWPRFEAWSDGHAVHAPVGSLRANPFGLHDVHGNVEEWCRDGYTLYTTPASGSEGLRLAEASQFGRVLRGGTFHQTARAAHAASRAFATEGTVAGSIGVRIARSLAPTPGAGVSR